MAKASSESKSNHSNDASASSFGWDFQVNAAIFLAVSYLQTMKDIKVETAKQDIEITTEDNEKIFAQAKSGQDYSTDKNKKEKFKDAIESLAKNPFENSTLIYISNLPDTFKNERRNFENVIEGYSSCPSILKSEIDKTIESILKPSTRARKGAKGQKISKIPQELKERIKRFPKNSLYICTIFPYSQDIENRYIRIREKIADFLANTVGLSIEQVSSITVPLLKYWQDNLGNNSTLKDNPDKKISKKEFTWPIIIYSIGDYFPDIDECFEKAPDRSTKTDAESIMNNPQSLFFERYEFTNRVIQDYLEFKQQWSEKNPDIEFIKRRAKNYSSEFEELSENDSELNEYLTKAFLYKIITKNRYVRKVCNATKIAL